MLPLVGRRAESRPLRSLDGRRKSSTWLWDARDGAWVRDQDATAHADNAGVKEHVANVVVRLTPYRESGVRDSRGAVAPEAAVVGEGDAWLLSGRRAQPGRWRKPTADAVTTGNDTAGVPLRLAPGTTWVEVLPPGSGRSSSTDG